MPLDKPFEKSTKTVTFVGEDGQELEVISNISKQGLEILKKQGYKKQSTRLREQEEEALRKHDLSVGGDDGHGNKEGDDDKSDEDSDDDDSDDSDDEKDEEPEEPKKAAPAKRASTARR